MSLREYMKLRLHARATLLWEKGIYIGSYSDANTVYNLYHLFNFFVESVREAEHDRIIEITGFEGGERLNKYLTKISIDELK